MHIWPPNPFFSNGYFENPQGFQRFNLFGKYSALLNEDQKVSITASAFQSSWDASGQVPERAIKNGVIGRFGAIDNTEGGKTSRINLNFEHIKSLNTSSLISNQLYFSDYAFSLFSNFTFFKIDSINGDAIHQKERRRMLGYKGSFLKDGTLGGKKLETEIGAFFRNDVSAGSELSRVRQRQYLTARLALGDINETNAGLYLSETWYLNSRFSINGGLRYDFFQFVYEDELDSLYHRKSATASVLSPKLNLYYDLNPFVRLYASGGYGFHSNDTRVVVQQDGLMTLPRATGFDLGVILKSGKKLLLNVAGWYLGLEQEFVYVGDEAVVEAGGRTARYGLDVSARVQLNAALFLDADFTYSHARTVDAAEGEKYIPLAPRFTNSGGISWDAGKGLYGSIRFRQLSDRPANEIASLVARGYFLLDAVVGFKVKNVEIGLSAQNLLNAAWKEAQFETESRLRFESAPVTEVNFTPGSPFFLKGGLTYRF